MSMHSWVSLLKPITSLLYSHSFVRNFCPVAEKLNAKVDSLSPSELASCRFYTDKKILGFHGAIAVKCLGIMLLVRRTNFHHQDQSNIAYRVHSVSAQQMVRDFFYRLEDFTYEERVELRRNIHWYGEHGPDFIRDHHTLLRVKVWLQEIIKNAKIQMKSRRDFFSCSCYFFLLLAQLTS